MKGKYHILSLKHSQNAEYLYFLLNDADTKGVSLDVNEACVVFGKPDYPKDGLLYVPIKLIRELEREMTMFSQGDQVVFNTPENLDKLGLKEEDGVLMQVQQYYLLSTKHTDEYDDRLYFLTKDYKEEDESIVGNIQKAWLTTSLDKDDVDYLFLEKEKVEAVAGFECVENTPETLSALGLGFEFGVLCPIEEEQKQQYYVLSAVETNENTAHLFFVTENVENKVLNVSDNLNKAWLSDSYSNKESGLIYIEKEKIDVLTYSTIKKEKFVDNSRENRIKLGLKYKDGMLQRARGEEVEEDYVLLLEDARKERFTLSVFSNNGRADTIDLRGASTDEAPMNKTTIYIKKEVAESLATLYPDGSRVLLNCDANLKALGLHYNEEGLLRVIQDTEQPEYYFLDLDQCRPTENFIFFISDSDPDLNTLDLKTAAIEADTDAICERSARSYPVLKTEVDALSIKVKDSLMLVNSSYSLKELGLEYKGERLQAIEKKEPETPKEKQVSYLGIALKIYSLYNDLMAAKEQLFPKPKNTSTPEISIASINIVASNVSHEFYSEKLEKEGIKTSLKLLSKKLKKAQKALKKKQFANYTSYQNTVQNLAFEEDPTKREHLKGKAFRQNIKDSFEDQVAEAAIHLLKMVAVNNIDLDKYIQTRLSYEKSKKIPF